MKSKFLGGLLIAFMVMISLSSCERIDAGCEGIKVSLYGDDKGVGDVALVTGRVWYNPITTEIYEYPMYVQTVDYPAFEINAKDGSKFTVDPTINVNPMAGKAPEIFSKYRKPLEDVIQNVLVTHIKNAYRLKLNAYTTDDLVSKREEFEKATEDYLREVLAKENFVLGEMTSGLKYPESLEMSITAKNKAVQEAMQVENEIRVAEAEAKKLIVAAEAEKKANELKQQALTPAILEKMWIEKWDGKLPVYGQVPTIFKDISK
jgi:regulator of protease activity HflC (stomatin/prohibitin superfamily)